MTDAPARALLDGTAVCGERTSAHLRARKLHLTAKRATDVVAAAILLVLLSPLLVLAALLVKITSPGPAFFVDQRWGEGERLFRCYKLRTMREGPHRTGGAEPGVLEKRSNDPRVTRIGAILRRTSIDELPQLLNVVRGEMSLVGPRPLVPHMLAPYPEFRAMRCSVRPGITGLWQVRDRARNTHVAFMAVHDLEYIMEFSYWRDLQILLLTAGAVLSGRGAV